MLVLYWGFLGTSDHWISPSKQQWISPKRGLFSADPVWLWESGGFLSNKLRRWSLSSCLCCHKVCNEIKLQPDHKQNKSNTFLFYSTSLNYIISIVKHCIFPSSLEIVWSHMRHTETRAQIPWNKHCGATVVRKSLFKRKKRWAEFTLKWCLASDFHLCTNKLLPEYFKWVS